MFTPINCSQCGDKTPWLRWLRIPSLLQWYTTDLGQEIICRECAAGLVIVNQELKALSLPLAS